MKDKDLLKLLKKNGWSVVRINGSHHILQKDGKTIVIPLHGKDVPIGLVRIPATSPKRWRRAAEP